MGHRNSLVGLLRAGLTACVGITMSGVSVAQSGGTSNNGDGIPQIVIVGLAVLGLVVLYFALRNSLQSGSSEQSSYSGGGRDYQPPQRGGEDRINRRNILLAGVVGAGGAWILLFRDTEVNNSVGETGAGIEPAVETYWQAIDTTDEEMWNEIIHPDGLLPEMDDGDLDIVEPVDYTLENIEIVEQSDERATTRVDFIAEGPRGTIDETTEVELRRTDGGWKVYNDPVDFNIGLN